jgi:hypothetical protein
MELNGLVGWFGLVWLDRQTDRLTLCNDGEVLALKHNSMKSNGGV